MFIFILKFFPQVGYNCCLSTWSISLFIFLKCFFAFFYYFLGIYFIHWSTNDNFGFTHNNLNSLSFVIMSIYKFYYSSKHPFVFGAVFPQILWLYRLSMVLCHSFDCILYYIHVMASRIHFAISTKNDLKHVDVINTFV